MGKRVRFNTLPESDEDERISTAKKNKLIEKAREHNIELILNEPRRKRRIVEESEEEEESVEVLPKKIRRVVPENEIKS